MNGNFYAKLFLAFIAGSCFYSLHGSYSTETPVDDYLRLKETPRFKRLRSQRLAGIGKEKAKKNKKQKNKEYASHISTLAAFKEIDEYCNHLIKKHAITLSPEEHNDMIEISKGLIIKNSHIDGTIASTNFRKIKKALKNNLKFFYPEKFVSQKTKITELDLRNARKSIRATIKDFLEYDCNIKDREEVRRLWKSVKPAVQKELEASSIPTDMGIQVVSIAKIPFIIQFAKQKLADVAGVTPKQKRLNKNSTQQKETLPPAKQKKQVVPPQSKAPKRSWRKSKSTPPRQPKKYERAVPLTFASQDVLSMLSREALNQAEIREIHKNIMRKLLANTTPRNRLLPSVIKKITEEEVANFKEAKKQFPPKKSDSLIRSRVLKKSRSLNRSSWKENS